MCAEKPGPENKTPGVHLGVAGRVWDEAHEKIPPKKSSCTFPIYIIPTYLRVRKMEKQNEQTHRYLYL
jgi:hypothetical protein